MERREKLSHLEPFPSSRTPRIDLLAPSHSVQQVLIELNPAHELGGGATGTLKDLVDEVI